MQKLQELMEKEMTRKEFLATIGFGVASVFGLATLLRMLTGKTSPLQQNNNNSLGYGDGAYGGNRNRS